MSKFYIVLLTVTVLLPVVCNAVQCTDGTVTGDNATDFVELINGYREKLTKGTQTNGKSPDPLPKAGNIADVEWDCTLEETLQKELDGLTCGQIKDKYTPSAALTADHATEYTTDYYDYEEPDDGEKYEFRGWNDMLTAVMKELDNVDTPFLIEDGQVKLSGTSNAVRKYAEWVRSDVTKVACAVKKCPSGGMYKPPEFALVCATDKPPLEKDAILYDILISTTSTTAITTTATTTTTVTPTTIAPTTIAPTSTAPAAAATTKLATTAAKGSTGTPCPTYSTTPCPTYSTTPCPTYPTTPCPTYPPGRAKREAKTNADVFVKKAKFPKATAGDNTICSSNKGMTDSLRTLFLNMHNYRRAKLALGEVNGYDRKRMPPARNMLKLSYACKLESSALRYAAHCPSMRSKASARPNQGENFLRLAKVGFPDFADAVNMTVYNWWDVVRDTPGIDKNVKLQTRRLRSPIVTFTQMAWATTRYLGCAIADCNSYYVSICRYSPKGNAIGEMVYKPGHTCTECKRGTTCEEELGLCV